MREALLELVYDDECADRPAVPVQDGEAPLHPVAAVAALEALAPVLELIDAD